MVEASNAVQIAEKALNEVVPTFAALKPHVEEIHQSRDGEAWIITYRADNPSPKSEKTGYGEVFFPYLEKIVRISLQSGDLLSVQNPSYE